MQTMDRRIAFDFETRSVNVMFQIDNCGRSFLMTLVHIVGVGGRHGQLSATGADRYVIQLAVIDESR